MIPIKVKKMTQIKDLIDGQKRVNLEATIGEKGSIREVKSKFNSETFQICDTIIIDDTGSIKLTLWGEEIEKVETGDKICIENGYVTSFKGEIQLNVGKYGKMIVNPQ